MLENIWVLSEKTDALAELCGGSKKLAASVTALIIGSESDAETVSTFGADKIYLWRKADHDLFEDFASPIAELASAEKPDAIIIRATRRARGLAGRLAARVGTSVMTNVESCELADGRLIVESLMFGGGAVRAQSAAGVSIIVVGGAFMQPLEAPAAKASLKIMEDSKAVPSAKLIERKPRETESVDLTAAKQIIGVGRGFAEQKDIALAEMLARQLKAELACTRPIAEGENWMPRERYIGVSGAMLKPEIYWAVGVSGQVQHMVGVTGAKTIVAINKDKNAPIFKQCDYGLVGDLYKILPIITKILSK
jgi:electron transfer flavoprotein alpha subunit